MRLGGPAQDLLPHSAQVRLAALFVEADPRYRPPIAGLIPNDELVYGPPAPLYDGADELLRSRAGLDLSKLEPPVFNCEDACRADWRVLALFLQAARAHLVRIQQSTGGRAAPVTPGEFEGRVNAIMEGAQRPERLRSGEWVTAGATAAEALRRVLLADADDMAGCTQGDMQVEMVASTVQDRLSQKGAVLVDYGAGLGRVLAGLASAPKLAETNIIAIEDAANPAVRGVAAQIGAKLTTRAAFLGTPTAADVIMVVNTLHHIPFREVGAQFAGMMRALKPDGVMLIHDMAELREPEQRNVPWRMEDVLALFQLEALELNPRSTTSRRKKVPIWNLIVGVADREVLSGDLEARLAKNAERVWMRMKARTLERIERVYARREPNDEAELQYELITNANLDLNRP